MKKRITLLLAAAVLLGLSACGNAEGSMASMPDTTGAKNFAVAADEGTAASSAHADLLASDQVWDMQFWLEKCGENEVITLPITDPEHCVVVLHSLGFYEFHTGTRTAVDDKQIPLRPKELTIAGDSFKLVFDYKLPSATTSQLYDMKDYVLYGTKSDKADYLVKVSDNSLVEEWIFDWNGEEVAQGNYFCHLIYYSADTKVDGANWVTNTIRYYEDSHNLYNIVKAVPAQDPDKDDTPRILAESRELLADHLEANKKTETVEINGSAVEVGEFAIAWDSMETTFQYHVGMTLEEWAVSDLNTSGWEIGEDHCLYYQEHIIRNSHYDVRWLFAHGTTIEAERK